MITLRDVEAVARLMAAFSGAWWVAGGWAIDLWVGRVTREHGDLEIGAYRRDQAALRAYLAGWDLSIGVQGPQGGQWVPWGEGEWLELPVHQIKAERAGAEPHEFEFFLNEARDGLWWSRRHQGLSRPLEEVSVAGLGGLPVLAPEIQLLFKAKYHRPKDEHDFTTALPLLGGARRAWLQEALQRYHPGDPWSDHLA